MFITFNEDRKKLIADGYGNLDKPNAYGSGALFVKNTDVIFCEDTPVTIPTEPIVAHSGLSKIAPIAHELTQMSFTTADMNIALKLNEVIEKVNRIIDILNQGVKGNENKSYKIT
jgi:hypothetical protein